MLTIDPALFHPDAVSAETRAFNAELESMLAEMPPMEQIPPEVLRREREAGKSIFPVNGPLEGSYWLETPTRLGRVRVSPARDPRGIYIHIHGGGWTLGAPHHADPVAQAIAAACGLTVVSTPYRLAPEHPWPAGPDDCLEGALWALDHAETALGAAPIAIGGESAGGHLTAVTLLRLRELGRLDGIRGAVLNYGVFDLRMTPSLALWGARDLILSTPKMAWFIENLDPGGAMRSDPLASPVLADLSSLPRALFQCGTEDPLIDDTLLMATRWAAAGLDTEVEIYPGGCHALDGFDLEIARRFRGAEAAFLNSI